jgi:predicted MFS family arabinose efflux permease
MGTMFSMGLTLQIFGVFVEPVAESLGASIAVMGLAPVLWQCVNGVGSAILGRLLGRVSIRAVMISGAGLLATGLVLLSRVETLLAASFVLGGIVSVGSVMVGSLPGATLATNWFVERRGRALGIIAAGSTGSGMLFPPLAAWLIGLYGWRHAFLLLGVGVAGVAIPSFLALVVDRPEAVGESPDGRSPAPDATPAAPPASLSEILANRNFWLIGLTFGLLFSASLLPVLFTIPYAKQIGFSLQGAAWIMAARSAAAICGKIAITSLSDRLGRRPLLWGVIASQFVLWLVLVETQSFERFTVACVLIGFVAAAFPLQNALVGATFGRESFPRAMGLLYVVELPFQLLSAPIGGFIYDTTGDYAAPFRYFLPVFLVAALLLVFVKDPSPAQRAPPR